MSRRASLARGAPPAEPGTLHARSATGEATAGPEPGRTVRFGRGERPETDLCVGGDDLRVSRRHGELTYRHRRWWLRVTGWRPLRLPGGVLLHRAAAPTPLAAGYTPVFVRGSGYREYLIELHVTGESGPAGRVPLDRPLGDEERLLLVVLGQRYLRHEPAPRPLPRRRALQQLRILRPDTDWDAPGIDRRVAEIHARLAGTGAGAGRGDGPGEAAVPPHDLLADLLADLVATATLVPPDLALLDGDFDP